MDIKGVQSVRMFHWLSGASDTATNPSLTRMYLFLIISAFSILQTGALIQWPFTTDTSYHDLQVTAMIGNPGTIQLKHLIRINFSSSASWHQIGPLWALSRTFPWKIICKCIRDRQIPKLQENRRLQGEQWSRRNHRNGRVRCMSNWHTLNINISVLGQVTKRQTAKNRTTHVQRRRRQFRWPWHIWDNMCK